MEITEVQKSYLVKTLLALGIILSLYFLVKTVGEIKTYRFIGGGATATNNISFQGKGEVFAPPNLALVNITIREKGADMTATQTKAATKKTAVLDFLDKSGVDKKDIKTENYGSYPTYEYVQCYSYMMPCRDETKITGYETSEYVSVKVRDIAKAGTIVGGVGALGISEISGPNYTIENEDEVKAKARKMAIDDAKEKAESLSKDLGVRLVRIVNFSENGDYAIYNFAKDSMAGNVASVPESAPSPELSIGQNRITSNVTITYEIR